MEVFIKKILLLFIGLLFSFGVNSIAAPGKTANLKISTKGDQLAFDQTSLSAKAGQAVKLVFHNAALKNSGLQHNWVLVKPGTANQVADASINAGIDKGWVADSPDIIAHTKLLNAGESETLEFTAPTEPGDYQFICTFPGHAQTMRGVFHITK